MIKKEECSTYNWDHENNVHACSTCKYHRSMNFLFTLDKEHCKDINEARQFIRGFADYISRYITKKNIDDYYHQALIKIIKKYTNIRFEKYTEREVIDQPQHKSKP